VENQLQIILRNEGRVWKDYAEIITIIIFFIILLIPTVIFVYYFIFGLIYCNLYSAFTLTLNMPCPITSIDAQRNSN